MPPSVSPTFPGVYVQTVIKAQPPATGVATGVAAFIGRTPRGPVNQPITLLSFADYERTFGGLDATSAVSYQASAFFNNGGSQAEVVRLYRAPTASITAKLGSVAAGDYSITFAPLVSGPTIQVRANVQGNTPDPYGALAESLSIEPALMGLVSKVNATAQQLTFDLTYPASISGGGGIWSFQLGSDPAKATVQTPTGSALLTFTPSPTSFTLKDLPANTALVVTLAPPGGSRVVITVPATAAVVTAANLATQLVTLIMQSAQARQLVKVKKSAASLEFTYLKPASITLAQTAGGQSTPITPDAPTISGALQLVAANPGAWGNALIAMVDIDGITASVSQSLGMPQADLFNLTVIYGGSSSAVTERFSAVTLTGNGPNRLDKVLENQSNLVRVTDLNQPTPGTGSWAFGSGGVDSVLLLTSDYTGDPASQTGLYAFSQKPYAFNILSIPPDDTTAVDGGNTDVTVYQEAAQICVDNNAMLIIDPPTRWQDSFVQGELENLSLSDLGSYTAAQARACAVYFPRVVIADPLSNGLPKTVVPSGYIAAVWASTDTAEGVWKAPAGLDAPIGGITRLQANLNNAQNGVLNPQGINALRFFAAGGDVVWGARTLRGADQLADEYKYIPVQRLLNHIASSLRENTRWAVFQPNGDALWASLTTQATQFMTSLFSRGAFSGTSPSQAFFVSCNATTTTAADQAAGVVNLQVGFAPIRPAEFVVITISQQAAKGS